MKGVFKTVGAFLTAFVLYVVLSNVLILISYQGYIEENPDDLTAVDVGLVLGTSRWTTHGEENQFFTGRVDAASTLLKEGVVRHLILSGDNAQIEYNEPIQLQDALKDRGVQEEKTTLDYAGFRTLDSVVRSKEVFGQDSVIIISQDFHLPRAIFIARKNGIKAYGFAAGGGESFLNTRIREYFARALSVADVYILRRRPRFLGESEQIIIQ